MQIAGISNLSMLFPFLLLFLQQCGPEPCLAVRLFPSCLGQPLVHLVRVHHRLQLLLRPRLDALELEGGLSQSGNTNDGDRIKCCMTLYRSKMSKPVSVKHDY